ncbi:MAG: hypothetical protein ACRDQW_08525 [Haloechinothrix sp.]
MDGVGGFTDDTVRSLRREGYRAARLEDGDLAGAGMPVETREP